ncbi:glycosyltransferase family 4 protein [Paenarthrobacter nitroguajacolicus]|uniref:glycosyltransferase family 4 protein n=1 Tax=Paenarthrobacter nitroguajacolicus TaxID=211146 RepID=UPI0028584EEB|nr:glycosyltransferase family 4 protein [Paenarthrobacter nitroguajacolicus]MDR6636655.1 glycosyltransferase involved in cell wall biosynthesis [Paenarthrobacter nitroguajacolicus]
MTPSSEDPTLTLPRTLLVKTRGRSTMTPAERELRERMGTEPRSLLFEQVLNCDVLDENALERVTGFRSRLYKHIPAFAAQAIEATVLSRSYDVVITWSERHSVAVAAMFALLRIRTPHLAMMFWLSKPAVRWPLRFCRNGVDRLVTWSSVQRDVAIRDIGFGAGDVELVRHPVDLEFFSPRESPRTIIFSAGSTERDFRTLAEAAKDMDATVRIAASLVVALDGYKIVTTDVRDESGWPDNFDVRPLTSLELREAYAAAQVVVVPLLPTDIDAGVNVILEGMAMGRPVVATQTRGQVDVVNDGQNGLFVPAGDAKSLRERLDALRNDPEYAEELGRRARSYVEAHHSLESFVDRVRDNVATLAARPVKRRRFRKVVSRAPVSPL